MKPNFNQPSSKSAEEQFLDQVTNMNSNSILRVPDQEYLQILMDIPCHEISKLRTLFSSNLTTEFLNEFNPNHSFQVTLLALNFSLFGRTNFQLRSQNQLQQFYDNREFLNLIFSDLDTGTTFHNINPTRKIATFDSIIPQILLHPTTGTTFQLPKHQPISNRLETFANSYNRAIHNLKQLHLNNTN